MNLNDIEHFRQLDPEDMIGHINGLPDQLWQAWELGQGFDLPQWTGLSQVVVAGMGGSAIGADLLAAYAASQCHVPLWVHRDYDLPAWAQDESTLVICSSHSGNTEEVLSAFERAQENGCRILAITANGELVRRAQAHGFPLWQYHFEGQPRAAVGYSFGLLLAVFTHLGLILDPSEELQGAVASMEAQAESLQPEIPVASNPAKRMAGQLMDRWVTIYGAGLLAPVARRWKTQINEVAKAQASFELLPEADHNTLQGVLSPKGQFGATMNVFLRASANHPRNQLREDFTRQAIMLEGQNTDSVKAQGDSPLAQMWTLLHYGDYTAYYLAMAYGVDPTPVPMLQELKGKMKSAE